VASEPTSPGAITVDIGMPRLSDSMEEATVLVWLKRPGDRVSRGEPLVEVETDKATMVYSAELDGVVDEIVVEEGAAAALGAVIARVRVEGAAPPAAVTPAPEAAVQAPPAPASPAPAPSTGRARATPVARRLAGKLGVDLDRLGGTGPGGRIVVSDVEAAAGGVAAAPPPAGEARGTATAIEHSATQRTIAQRMSESRSSIPEFTLEVVIDMEEAASLRAELARAGHDPVPSFNDLVVEAVAAALGEVPALNASYEPGGAVRHGRINVGIAVDVDDALLVPTIRDADRLSLLEIAAESRRLAEAARARRLAPDDLADGTFTVSNLGMFGVRRFHAVINPPQAAILAVGAVAPRAVVDEAGAVVARATMDVTLSCDHRIVYGAEAARFLQRLRELLEQPGMLGG
jgi:pyruvate dehydrogenase E2 component (dihydrolipoamide acetyltransferase)